MSKSAEVDTLIDRMKKNQTRSRGGLDHLRKVRDWRRYFELVGGYQMARGANPAADPRPTKGSVSEYWHDRYRKGRNFKSLTAAFNMQWDFRKAYQWDRLPSLDQLRRLEEEDDTDVYERYRDELMEKTSGVWFYTPERGLYKA